MPSRKYVLISPCRDEENYLEATLHSVAAQTELPALWVVVDDGSTDRTAQILSDFQQNHPWLSIVTLPPRKTRVLGSGVIHAFNAGLASIDLQEFDYVAKVDMDLRFPADYFERVMNMMEAEPRLATVSGTPFVPRNGVREYERGSVEISWGAAKFYRVQAFIDIGGFVPKLMWDGIDCHTARLRGWLARSSEDPSLGFEHLRPMGSSDKGILRGRRRHGWGQYYMGSHPLFVLASAVRRIWDRPQVLGSLSILAGYASGAAQRAPRYPDRRFRRQLRRFQMEALVVGKERAVARWDERSRAAFGGAWSARRIAYLVTRHPMPSHSFISTEIDALIRLGWAIHVFSVRPGELDSVRPDRGTRSWEVETLLARSPRQLLRTATQGASVLTRVGPRLVHLVRAAVDSEGEQPRRWVGLAYLVEAAYLAKRLDELGVAHVHVHFANNGAEIARLAALVSREWNPGTSGLSWSLTVHGLWMHGLQPGTASDWPDRNASRWGGLPAKLEDALFIRCIDGFARRKLMELNPAVRDKIHTVHLGIDTSQFSSSLDEGRREGFVVVNVGRLAPEKDLTTLINGFERFAEQRPWAQLVVVGDGAEGDRLRALAAASAVAPQVRFVGTLKHSELPRVFANADVFAMTSLSEGVPTTLMEAMASGVAVVSTDVGGVGELVTAQDGILIQPGAVEQLAEALERLESEPTLRERLGDHGRRTVCEKFDAATQAIAISRVFDHYLGTGTRDEPGAGSVAAQ